MDPTLLYFSLPSIHASAFVPSMWLSGVHSLPASSAALPPQTPKVLQAGARSTTLEKGKMAKRATVCFLSSFKDTWQKQYVAAKKRKCVFFNISSRSCDTSICLNGANDFWHSLSLGNEPLNKSVLDESKTLLKLNSSPPLKTANCAELPPILHGGLWWMMLRHYVLFLNTESCFVIKACLNWLKKKSWSDQINMLVANLGWIKFRCD